MLCMWIPEEEREALEATVRTAVEKADSSDTRAGHDFLSDALERAEQLAAQGNPWGSHLAGLYRDALSLYNLAYADAEEARGSAGVTQPIVCP